MPGSVRQVDYGPACFDALCSEIAALQTGDRLAGVTVVVPSARAAISVRRRLAAHVWPGRAKGIAGITLCTMAAYLEQLAGPSLRAAGRSPATRAVLGAAVTAAARAEPGPLGALAGQRATELELLARYEELRSAGPAGISRLSRLGGVHAALARICSDARARLLDAWYDDVDLALCAEELVARGDRQPLVVYLPEAWRREHTNVLLRAAEVQETRVVLGFVGDESGDGPASRFADALVAGGFSLEDQTSPARPDDTSEVVTAPDPVAEVRFVLGEVAVALEAGRRPERIGLFFTSRQPYARLLEDGLADLGLCWSGPSPEQARGTASGGLLLALVDLAIRYHMDAVLDRAGLVALLAAAPVVDAGGGTIPFGEWDLVSRRAGISTGSERSWIERLASLEQRSPDDTRTRIAARGLRSFVEDLFASFKEAGELRSWSQLAIWGRACLDSLLGAEDDAAPLAEGPFIEPTVLASLDELAALDRVDPDVDLSRFAGALDVCLERPARFHGVLNRGVVVGSLEQAAALELDLAVVLGCVEGQLPSREPLSPLLERRGRELLEIGESAVGVVERDRRRLDVARRCASRVLFSVPVGDGQREAQRRPSRFLPPATPRSAPSAHGALGAVANGELVALSPAEAEVAELLRAAANGEDLRAHHLVAGSALLSEAFAVRAGRQGSHLTRFSGAIGRPSSALDDALAPTTLEHLARCPFSYFLEHELGASAVGAPERLVEITPSERGRLVHRILERFVAVLIDASARHEPLQLDEEKVLLRGLAEEEFDRAERSGMTGKPLLWELERRRLLTVLERACELDAERRANGARPIAVEHSFGEGDRAPLRLAIGGRSIALRGKVDRVDRHRDGTLEVIDYKTGANADLRRTAVATSLNGGRRLQLSLYALAAREGFGAGTANVPVVGTYRLLGEKMLDVVVPIDTEHEDELEEVLKVLVALLETGSYPARPGAPDRASFENCRNCAFDSVCGSDRVARWRAVEKSKEVAAYAALATGASDPGDG